MAVTIATLTGYLLVDTRKDIENDSNPAPYSTVNVRVESVGAGQNAVIVATVPTASLYSPAVPPPAAPALAAATTGGSLASGTEFVKVGYVTANGPTLPSAEASIAVVGPTGSVVVTSPAAAAGATTYNVYGASATGAETLIASGIAIGTNYTIMANAAAGAASPATSAPALAPLVNSNAPCQVTITQ